MRNLVGVYYAAALVLGVGGVAKVREPAPFVAAIRQLGVPIRRRGAQLAGLTECAVALSVFAFGGTVVPLVVAATYGIFAIVVIGAIRADAPSCGCFGAASSPPSTLHVAVNVVSCAAALAVANWFPGPFLTVIDDAGSAAPALVLVAIVLAALLLSINTVVGELLGEMRRRAARTA